MSPTSKGVSQPLESPGFILPRFVITLPQFGNGVVSTTVSDPSPTTVADPSLPTPQTGSPTSTVALPTYDHPSPTGVLVTASTVALLTYDHPSPTGVRVTASTVALPTLNHISSTGITTTANSFLALTSTSLIATSTPKSHITSTEIALPTFNPTHTVSSSSPHMTLSSAPVSSTLKAYDPVSTVTFSQLQASFSTIGVSSNILTAEVFLYGAYVVMFGLYLKVLRSRGIAKNRGLTVATILLFIFCTAHCTLQIATSTLYNRLESRSIGNSETLFNQTFKDYSSVAIATNAVYVTSNIIADTIFILRCYAIWNFQLKIIIFPILLTLAVAAGRIWWIGRTARTLLGRTVISKYHTACAMILESGAIYCVSAIAFAAIGFTLDQVYWTTGPILGQLVGIAPTIIAVRVGLGRSTKGARSGDEEAVEDPYRGSRKHTPRFNHNTPSTCSLVRPGSVLYIRSDG
ncbi:hypothetical protein B0H14DRAFT_3854400 [Mycena olivaceomarginata]|nr:hypothetical protein B0H14DRAFT_3854400 [Mycena olivaceomarginata]